MKEKKVYCDICNEDISMDFFSLQVVEEHWDVSHMRDCSLSGMDLCKKHYKMISNFVKELKKGDK